MAADLGHPSEFMIDRLRANPERFDFFTALRCLDASRPDLPRIGSSQKPSEDVVRFCQEPHLHFAPTSLQRFEEEGEGPAARLFVYCCGMWGPSGPLPLHLTEYARDSMRNSNDRTLASFMDMFHHRMLSLLYSAWMRNNACASYDRPDQDRFGVYVASFAGLGMPPLRNRDEIADEAKLHFAGHLLCQTRHAEGLASILADYFGLPTCLREFSGWWIDVPENARCHLGATPDCGRIGTDVVMGARMWDCQQKFRIRLGPMSFADYERMLPRGPSFRRLKAWVMNYVGYSLAWDAQLVLKASEVPEIQLGRKGKLGWTAWLRSEPYPRDAEDLVIMPS